MLVRECWPSDMEDILAMTVVTKCSDSLFDVLYEILFNKIQDKEAYVMQAEHLIVGVAVVWYSNFFLNLFNEIHFLNIFF